MLELVKSELKLLYLEAFFKSIWIVYGCEKDRTNLGMQNFSATADFLKTKNETEK